MSPLPPDVSVSAPVAANQQIATACTPGDLVVRSEADQDAPPRGRPFSVLPPALLPLTSRMLLTPLVPVAVPGCEVNGHAGRFQSVIERIAAALPINRSGQRGTAGKVKSIRRRAPLQTSKARKNLDAARHTAGIAARQAPVVTCIGPDQSCTATPVG